MKIGDINELIAFNQGGGNNQAIGALAFNGQQSTISRLSAYVTQIGSLPIRGHFSWQSYNQLLKLQLQLLQVTSVVTSLTGGLFIFSLTAPVTLLGNLIYYFVAYNQINGSTSASTGSGTVGDVFPIDFSTQNLPVLVVRPIP